MKNKKGFTLIELLAVIIILGILMIIAIPSVTKYISDSRKNSYVDTAKEIIAGARNLVNSGNLEMYDTDATYYIDVNCINTENAMKSPYGEFVKNASYVVVTYNGQGYDYYWTSVDDAGQGIKDVIRVDKLDIENIESDLTSDDISTYRGIDGRNDIIVISKANNCKKQGSELAIVQINGETGKEIVPVCRKATILHTTTCERASDGCGVIIGNGNLITYGTLVSGTPKAGDAYDCDVNDDGTYDSVTEKFYYVTSEGNNSVLIYYTNINDQTKYAYDSSNENYHGPRTAYQYLPSTTEWDNPLLITSGARSIVTENGNNSTTGGTIESFTYTNKAARFLTSQELVNSCSSISSVGNITTGELDGCNWLFENIGYYEKDSGTLSYGYWLETPRSDDVSRIWFVYGRTRRVDNSNANITSYYGVRPVITVKTSYLG